MSEVMLVNPYNEEEAYAEYVWICESFFGEDQNERKLNGEKFSAIERTLARQKLVSLGLQYSELDTFDNLSKVDLRDQVIGGIVE